MTDLAWICLFAPLVAAVWIGVSPRFRAGARAPPLAIATVLVASRRQDRVHV